jgi:hypothetical protein
VRRHDRRRGGMVLALWLRATGSMLVSTAVRSGRLGRRRSSEPE